MDEEEQEILNRLSELLFPEEQVEEYTVEEDG